VEPDGPDDLARLLAFEGAVPETDPEWSVVASEIIQLDLITPELCASIIRASELVGAWHPHDDDPVPGMEISLAAISPRLYAHLEDLFLVRAMPVVNEVWPQVEFNGFRDAFVIRYEAGVHDELRLHHDIGQISASVRLSDDYVGGELEFPRQGFSNVDVPVGSCVIWPSLVTHPHRSSPVTDGVKYGLTIWCELPGPPEAYVEL
jgi:hypothetical protein